MGLGRLARRVITPMNRGSFIFAAAMAVSLALIVLFSPHLQPKREALGTVIGSLFTGANHPLAVLESSGRVITSRHNLPVITRATEYIATLGSNTSVYREVARIAAAADGECPRLEKVLDLAVVRQSDSQRIVALAEAACSGQTPEQEAAWQRSYDALWATAMYPSVEAALVAMGAR
jgi:hypothetical protein